MSQDRMLFDTFSALTDKKAETFTFSEAERANILQQAESAVLLWSRENEPVQIDCTKKLKQLRKHEVSLILYASTLMEYKGFQEGY